MAESTTQLFAPNATQEIQPGSTLGSYEIVELIGKGAMGRVYKARHVRLGREVALKVLNPELVASADVVQRFFREARVVNDIDHENIVEVTDFVEQPGLAYLVMELLDGQSVGELMKLPKRKYPPVKRIVAIMTQVCAALEAAHAKGVIHRDLKPDNVIVVKRDGADFVKVLDFGVAKLRGGDHAETTAGMIIGTPHYMAPEQALGRDVDRATDVWSAGVVLYELLAGCVPFTGDSFVELAMQLREKPPKDFPGKTPRGERIPVWLAAVVLKCLEKKPADRYKSMAALAAALAAEGEDRSRGLPRKLIAVAAGVAVGVTGVGLAVRYDAPARARAGIGRVRAALHALSEPSPRPAAPPAAAGASATATPTPTPPKPPPAAAPVPAPAPAPVPPQPQAQAGTSAAPARPPTPPATSPPPPAPVAKPATAPAPPKPKAKTPAPAAAPPKVVTVELSLRSDPAGARVVRLDTGERLGRTPLRMKVPRKAANVWIQMTLDGFPPVKFAVDLRRDNTANVAFKGAKKTAPRRR